MGRLRLIPNPLTTTPEGTHPGFRNSPSTTLRHHNGFGPGSHYTVEIDPNDHRKMIVEPGETTRIWYFAPDSMVGFTAEEIAAASGVSVATVTPTWLNGTGNTGQYGLRSDRPLAWEVAGVSAIGRQLYNSRWTGSNALRRSEWAMLLRGGVYANQGLRPVSGESPLHPARWGAFGTGSRPVWDRAQSLGTFNHLCFTEMDFRQTFTYNGLSSSILYADCNFTCEKDAITTDGQTLNQMTLYGSSIIDCKEITPIAGGGQPATSWTATNANRSSGTFKSEIIGLLRWRTFWDRNGWDPTYNLDGVTWNNGEFGQPPSEYNHHNYDSRGQQDTTTRETIYARPPFDSIQGRSSAHINLMIDLEIPLGSFIGDGQITFGSFADATGPFPSGGQVLGLTSGKSFPVSAGDATTFKIESQFVGEYFDPGERIRFANNGTEATWVSYATHFLTIEGNTPYVNRYLVMGYAELEVFHGDKGGRGTIINSVEGQGNGGTIKNVIGANAVDPQHAAAELNNPDLRFRKNPTGRGFSRGGNMLDEQYANAYRFDNITVWNWGPPENDKNRPPLPGASLNRVTIGAWADAEQDVSLGTNNSNTACDYIRTRSDRCLLATDIWNYTQRLLGRPTIGHAPGAIATFSPDPDGNGWRTDSPDAWLINGVRGDFPVDGDSCRLVAQLAHSYDTWRFAEMDFGLGGGWLLHGGYISCETTQGNGSVELRGAGQFWLTTSSVDINVTAAGGRLGIAGTVSQVRGSFNGRSELLIDAGGALTISTSDTITLIGGNVKAGADGQSGTASLTVQGTLAFVASGGQMPRVREFRSGRYGLASPAVGVTGQPRDPNVTFNVTLASGSTITVDTTGLAPGIYDLIVCDSLTDGGATLPVNMAIVGGTTLRLAIP
jgi:hypothetical protein